MDDAAYQRAVEWVCKQIVIVTEGRVRMGDLDGNSVIPLTRDEYLELIEATGRELTALILVDRVVTVGDYARQIQDRFTVPSITEDPSVAPLLIVAFAVVGTFLMFLFLK